MILLALLAAAQSQPQPYRPSSATIVAEAVAVTLAGFDADGDARVTREEVTAGVARSFGTEPSIGYIAFADWAERWLGDRNAVPSALEVDRDGDNRITVRELQERFEAIFLRLDKDKDGALARAELLTVRTPPLDLRRRRDRDVETPAERQR
jgi:hypothetical protein